MPLKIMSLTDAAVERINEIIEDSATPVVGVRVGIKDAGCAGQSYTLAYVGEPVKGDDHIEEKGVHVYVEPKATLFLLGTVMDLRMSSSKSITVPSKNSVALGSTKTWTPLSSMWSSPFTGSLT